jgi:hypothetical protein
MSYKHCHLELGHLKRGAIHCNGQTNQFQKFVECPEFKPFILMVAYLDLPHYLSKKKKKIFPIRTIEFVN